MAPRKKKSSERFKLSERGFFYDDCVTENPLPRHVEALRLSMLDFAFEDLKSDIDIIKDGATAEKAKRFAKGGYSEENWKIFFRENFFNPIEQSALITNSSRRVSRCNYYYDSIIADSEATWVTFNGTGLGDSIPGPFENETQPRPDYGFYLPMYHLTDEDHIPETTEHQGLKWHESSTPSLVEPFAWSVLQELHKHGLRPSPVNFLEALNKKPRESNLKCFPWLVVEHKKQDVSDKSRRKAYRQAVNASGCAVRLNQIAAKYAGQLVNEAHIPPTTAVTTIGPVVKVWITHFGKQFMAYHDNESWQRCNRNHGGYVMQCVWEGNMTQRRDIVRFRFILENTYTWATRVFKPLIATYIDQWRLVHCKTETADSPSSTTQDGPRRSPRLPPRRDSRLPPDAGLNVETVASRLRAATAEEPKRRGGGGKFLVPPLEIEFSRLEVSTASDSDTEDDDKVLYWDDKRRAYVA